MRFVTLIMILLASPALGSDAVNNVPGDYPSIQEALENAFAGETILVAPGTYPENIDFLGKAVILKSSRGPEVTIIDGSQAGSTVVFDQGEGTDSVLEGFTIKNGKGIPSGGGVRCLQTSPRLMNNVITECVAADSSSGYGGGIWLWESHPVIKNNVIAGNAATEGGGIASFHSSPVILDNGIRENAGGGIWCTGASSLTVIHNEIIENTGGGILCHAGVKGVILHNYISRNKGSGVYLYDESSPEVSCNVIFRNKYPDGKGGGIHCAWYSASIISNNVIEDNLAQSGGGIYCWFSSPVIEQNTLRGNRALSQGGGVYCAWYSSPVIENTLFLENSAESGGGYSAYNHCDTVFRGCRFEGNAAASQGGGFYGMDSTPKLVNCVFFRNSAMQGGAIRAVMASNPEIVNTTLFDNAADKGGGICVAWGAVPALANTILWENQANTGPEIHIESGSVKASHSDIKGGWPGAGNIDADPLFVDPAQGDFHLPHISPCRDSGDNLASSLPPIDFEGDPRIAGAFADMGADEFHTHLYYTGDGHPGGFVEVKLIGPPKASPLGIGYGYDVLKRPLETSFGAWYLKLPVRWIGLSGSMPSEGVLQIPGKVPQHPFDFLPLQALIGQELTNLCILAQ